MWRQGDVMIAEVDMFPAELERCSHLVLAEGELTGHRHRVQEQDGVELWMEKNGLLYLKVIAETATIVHDEHNPITLKQGLYRVWKQREYSPDAFRPVHD